MCGSGSLGCARWKVGQAVCSAVAFLHSEWHMLSSSASCSCAVFHSSLVFQHYVAVEVEKAKD